MKTIRVSLIGKNKNAFEVEYIVEKGIVISYIVVEKDGLISDVKIAGWR